MEEKTENTLAGPGRPAGEGSVDPSGAGPAGTGGCTGAPGGASGGTDGTRGTDMNRRGFLGRFVSVAMAGVSVCSRQPVEQIVPYVAQPEHVIPGIPSYYATAGQYRGYARGLVVESHEGRPTRIDGNPKHPASLGGSQVFEQADVLNLYDPSRSQAILKQGAIMNWSDFLHEAEPAFTRARSQGGRGFYLLTGNFTSPTLMAQIRSLLQSLPEARFSVHDPLSGPQIPYQPVYHVDRANVIVSLDSDFLFDEPGSLRYAREFADGRRVRAGRLQMNRLYTAEPMATVTGMNADHPLAIRASEIPGLARILAARIGVPGVPSGGSDGEIASRHGRWIEAVAADLAGNAGASLVVCGAGMPASTHAVVLEMNRALGNAGRTVTYIEPLDAARMPEARSIGELIAALDAGSVDTLLITGCNPVYDAPADLRFDQRILAGRLRIHHGLHVDETARFCHWHVPGVHDLEQWSDARAYDGTTSINQPLIRPLYEGRSRHVMLNTVLGTTGFSDYEIVRATWKPAATGDFEEWWRTSLLDGVIPGIPPAREIVPPPAPLEMEPTTPREGLEIAFRPDPYVQDGRYANNPWLQELEKPVTGLTWDNAAMMSPETASQLRVGDERIVELVYRGRVVRAPVRIVPGHVDGAVTVHLGYGRPYAGVYGSNRGFSAYALRTSDAPWFGSGLEVRRTRARLKLATRQRNFDMRGREPVVVRSIGDIARGGSAISPEQKNPPETLFRSYDYDPPNYRWGMVIDLTTCIGCGACSAACQAENNIPIVGKRQVLKNRQMNWIRVDRYYERSGDETHVLPQPVPCMHCEMAPCELVCPTGATVHSVEGLNEMTYNRCIGTRYCSNNCPYKVRRFNFLQFTDAKTLSLRLQRNPNVTARTRGVMEKCTYCVQRIEEARIRAMKENRRIAGDEVVTACQAACPTRAIVFGDLNDPRSHVAQASRQPHDYLLLAELNTRPRTSYLARLRNPSPRMQGGA